MNSEARAPKDTDLIQGHYVHMSSACDVHNNSISCLTKKNTSMIHFIFKWQDFLIYSFKDKKETFRLENLIKFTQILLFTVDN